MDLGRQDFPAVLSLTKNWTVGALTGRASWLEESGIAMSRTGECFREDTEKIAQARVALPHDFVIPIPSRFALAEHARVFERPRLVFFSGSLNSCSRRKLYELYHHLPEEDVLVTDQILGSVEYRQVMHSSKYCLVLRGSSHTNNVRLYDVVAHGCIPVIVSDDFHPPLDLEMPWKDFALFFSTSALPLLVSSLRKIPDDVRWQYFWKLVLESGSAAKSLDWRSGAYWSRIVLHAAQLMREHCIMLKPAWWQSASELRAASVELYLRFLDGIECPRSICTTHAVSAGIFGCADAETLMPAIATIHRQLVVEGKNFVFIDGGSNTGKLTHKILASLGELFARRLLSEQPETEGRVSCPLMPDLPKIAVVSVEPSTKNFHQLRRMAEKQRWDLEDWTGVNCALADYDGNGSLSVFPEWSLDEVATLEPSSEGDDREQQPVDVVTLPTLRQKYFKGREVLLLKLDVEGAELPALLGARELLLERSVHFIVFEYSKNTWKQRLLEMVRYLFSLGYVCSLITERDLFPVAGVLWDDAYENIVWSNFLCVAIDNPLLPRLMSAYVADGVRTWNIIRDLQEIYS